MLYEELRREIGEPSYYQVSAISGWCLGVVGSLSRIAGGRGNFEALPYRKQQVVIRRFVSLQMRHILASVSDHSALESRMLGYWLNFAICLIVLGIIGALIIALKYGRITTEKHRYLLVACAAVPVAFGISQTLMVTFTDIQDKADSIGLRLTDLQKRVNANNAARQAEEQALRESTRRPRSGEGLEATTEDRQRDRIGAIAKEAVSLVEERQALEKEIAAVRAELEEAKRSKETREFWRGLVMIALMLPLLVLALRLLATRKG